MNFAVEHPKESIFLLRSISFVSEASCKVVMESALGERIETVFHSNAVDVEVRPDRIFLYNCDDDGFQMRMTRGFVDTRMLLAAVAAFIDSASSAAEKCGHGAAAR